MRRPILTACLTAMALLGGCGDRTAGQPDAGSPVESAVPSKRFNAGREVAVPQPAPGGTVDVAL